MALLAAAVFAWPVVGVAGDSPATSVAADAEKAQQASADAARNAATEAAKQAARSIARDAENDLDVRFSDLHIVTELAAPVTVAAN